MREIRIALVVALVSSWVGVFAEAADPEFSEQSLQGAYAFMSSTDSVMQTTSFNANDQAVGAVLHGVLEADGLGNVTGVRRFERIITERVGFTLPRHHRVEVIEQTFTGTYSVDEDGTGTMRLVANPTPPWDIPFEGQIRVFFTGGTELVRFTLAEGGRRFLFAHEFQASRLDRSETRDTDFVLKGHAETQDPLEIPEPEPDPRIDELIGLLEGQDARIDELAAQNDVLKAQLCEVLRLLNTPQGQRVSDSPDVVDACGTAFAWNGEGTDGPRRGR